MISGAVADWHRQRQERRLTRLQYITQGMIFSQISAVVDRRLVVTSEYGTGLIRATLAATPVRSRVLAAKAIVAEWLPVRRRHVTAFLGYFGGNAFFSNKGIGISLGDEHILRSMFGGGLYMAGLGLLAAAVGLLVRHTAAAISIVLALVFIIGQVVSLIPGTFGEWVMKLMPGNAGPGIVVAGLVRRQHAGPVDRLRGVRRRDRAAGPRRVRAVPQSGMPERRHEAPPLA